MRSQTATAEIGVKDTLIKKPRRHGIRFNKKYLMCLLIVSIPLIGFVAFSGFPVILSFISMFCDMKYNKLDTLTWNNFANFQRLFSDATLLQSVKVTLIIASAQFVSLAIAITIAAFLSQNVKGTRVFQTLFFVPYICSTVAIAIMWTQIFGGKGALNAILGTNIQWLDNQNNPYTLTIAIFISIIWQAPGYGIVMYCSAFKAINPSLYEAAALDGANAFQKFRHITLPGITSITLFLVLAGILTGFTTFEAAQIMAPDTWTGVAGPDNAGLTIMYYIYREGVKFGNMGYASVLSWLLFLVLMIPSAYLIRKKILAEN